MPRTTIDIDASVLRQLKKRQERERKPLGQLVSELVAKAIELEDEPAPQFNWVAKDLRPRVDLDDKGRDLVHPRRAVSQTVDTDVLVYASHTGSPFHDRARGLVEHLVSGPSLAYLWPAVLGYLRIVTHPAILGTPLSPDEAISNVEAVFAPSHARVAGEGDDFWTSFRRVAADVRLEATSFPTRTSSR